MDTQYHHYIPQFILRNFGIEKIKDKKNINIKYYDIKKNNLEICKTSKKYGVQNLYKNLNTNDMMEVEKELGKLENKCSTLLDNINNSKDFIKISRKDIFELRKFLYIMMYRKDSRKKQYTEGNFDYETQNMLIWFMKKNNYKSFEEVWLNNIKYILKSNYNEIKYNNKIFPYIRWEYTYIMNSNFTCIWEAQNAEFILTNKCFGLYEGPFPIVAYHWFFVISPKRIIVLSNQCFRKDIDEFIYNKISMLVNQCFLKIYM